VPDRVLRVLYLHATATFGGASKSLCELFKAMPPGSVQATVVCPPGGAAEQFREAGMRVVTARGVPKWDHTRFSYYRRLRWVLLLREAACVLPAWLGLRRARRLHGTFDLVHVNDVTVLLAGRLAARMFGVPLVVHARSLQNDDQRLRRTRWQNRLLAGSHVIAIDETVRRTLPADMPVTVIHNGLSAQPAVASRIADDSRPFRVAIVGVLLRLKGVFEFVEAARLCREQGLRAEFWIVGANARTIRGLYGKALAAAGFAEDVHGQLAAEIERHGLQGQVKLLGFVRDTSSIYRQIDVLCFPSHLDAAGRPVFEAAWFGVPSIVAARDPLPDTIVHGESGLCIDERDPAGLAAAIGRLEANPAERARLGEGARRQAERFFDQGKNSLRVLEIYRRLAGTT
jgi:glycosyltransferase involved in cell wall biosynthesis